MIDEFNREPELSRTLKTDAMTIFFYDLPAKFSAVYHSYEYARVCTILEGEVLAVVDGKVLRCDENNILIMSPECNVKTNIVKQTKALVFELNDCFLKLVGEKVASDIMTDQDLVAAESAICVTKSTDFQDVCSKIVNLLTSNVKNDDFLLNLYAQEMVYHIMSVKGARQVLHSEANQPVHKAIKFIRDNYMFPITIKHISAELRMSDTSFCQYFKKSIGFNPKEFLTNIRMEKAIVLLKNASVTDTAYNLGYENVSRFIAVFKGTYGETPKQYKMNTK